MSSFPSDQHIIETPEQVRLQFEVAGIGSRFLALALDTLIQTGVMLVLLILASIAGALLQMQSPWVIGGVLLGLFALYYGYFVVFEVLWNGQTPGKRVLGIRVIKDSGRPLTPAESIARNLLRIVDQLPAVYAIGIVVAAFSSRNKRLGDHVAGAILVRETALNEIRPAWSAAGIESPETPVAGAVRLTVEELALIDAFLNRRSDLAANVRARMAQDIVARVREKCPSGFTGSAEDLLEALASETRRSGGIS